MFCNQCEQTVQEKGCTTVGVCGKSEKTAAMQDLLTYAVRGFCQVAVAGRKLNVHDPDADRFVLKAMFLTLTNVNFDPVRFKKIIKETVAKRED